MKENFYIQNITDAEAKSACVRRILEELPEWFGNQQAVEEYAETVKELPLWAALDENGQDLGFFAGKIRYGQTGEIVVCGVRPAYHRAGLGKALYTAAEEYFRQNGCRYMLVKTLSDTVDFAPYDQTRRFYQGVGFTPLITLTEMWDEENPCLLMLKSLE